MDWVAALFSLIGATLIANRKWYGFIVAILSNASWITYGSMVGSFPLQAESVAYFFINLYGIYFWKIKNARL